MFFRITCCMIGEFESLRSARLGFNSINQPEVRLVQMLCCWVNWLKQLRAVAYGASIAAQAIINYETFAWSSSVYRSKTD